MRKMFQYTTVSSLVLFAFLFIGCGGPKGPKVYPVTGKVTLDGDSLEGATIVFLPATQGGEALSAAGKTDAQGAYTIQTNQGTAGGGTTPGEYKITITKKKEIWDGKSYRPNPGGEPIKDSRAVDALPDKYAKVTLTPFSATVTTDKEKNVFNFELQSK